MMKKLAFFSLVALTASVMADDMSEVAEHPELAIEPPVVAESTSQTPASAPELSIAAENAATVALSPEPEFRLIADLLLWRTEEGGTEWAADVSDETNPIYKKMNFDWRWGFRLGMGICGKQEGWNSDLVYTWFRSNATSSLASDSIESLSPQESGYTSAVNKWHISYNVLDWDLGTNCISRPHHFMISPHGGLKFGWINQHSRASLVKTEGTEIIHNKSKFFGVGPSAGCKSQWRFCEKDSSSFNLFGDLSGALLWGDFDISQTYTDYEDDTTTFGGLDQRLVTPVVSAIIGFGWNKQFEHDGARLAVNLGYELQYWFRQNQFMNVNSDVNMRIAQDLAFQGGTLEFRFDF